MLENLPYYCQIILPVVDKAFAAVMFQVSVWDLDQTDSMLGQNIPASLVVDAALFTSAYAADGSFSVEKCNRFGVLPFPILYNKVEFRIIGIDG